MTLVLRLVGFFLLVVALEQSLDWLKSRLKRGPLMPVGLVMCPYCRENVLIESPTDRIPVTRRNCPECGREFLVKGKAEKSQN